MEVDMNRGIHCYRCVKICDDVQGQFVWKVVDRGFGTRILPEGGQSLLKSGCVSCGACVDTCPTGALEDKTVLSGGRPDSWTRSVCGYCGVGCELEAGVRGDRITGIRPVLDSPVNRGQLCSKGRYAFGFVDS